MKKVLLLVISSKGSISGVERHLETFLDEISIMGLGRNFCLIEFTAYDMVSIHIDNEISEKEYRRIRIPMPRHSSGTGRCNVWKTRFKDVAAHAIKDILKDFHPEIIHFHTMNLIDLAISLKDIYVGSHIVSHIHCIPWKYAYDTDQNHFNKLYRLSNDTMPTGNKAKAYITQECELSSYKFPDYVICVSRAVESFIRSVGRDDSIGVVENGINIREDIFKREFSPKTSTDCLFVGSVSKSKGVEYIFAAIEGLRKESVNIRLHICGKENGLLISELSLAYPNVDFKFWGTLPYKELTKLYKSCDFGILPSLHEQSSYVALEMMSWGLPLISSNVDGLKDMLEDTTDSLVANVIFSPILGLRIDTEDLKEKMKLMATDPKLRETISDNAKKKIENRYTAREMAKRIINIYETIS